MSESTNDQDISPTQRRIRKALPSLASIGLIGTVIAVGVIGDRTDGGSPDVGVVPNTEQPVESPVESDEIDPSTLEPGSAEAWQWGYENLDITNPDPAVARAAQEQLAELTYIGE